MEEPNVIEMREVLGKQGVAEDKINVYVDEIMPLVSKLYHLCDQNAIALLIATQITEQSGSHTVCLSESASGFKPESLAAASEVIENRLTRADLRAAVLTQTLFGGIMGGGKW